MAVPNDKMFGVYTGKKSSLIAVPSEGPNPLAVLETSDGLTHHIRVVDRTAKYLRYVLRHDQKEFLIVVGDVVVHPPTTLVNCITCLARGPELPEVDDEMCVAETGERNATPLQRS